MAGGQQQQSIDLSVLSLEQLNQMKTQHEEEVQSLSGNFMKLRDAQVQQYVCTLLLSVVSWVSFAPKVQFQGRPLPVDATARRYHLFSGALYRWSRST